MYRLLERDKASIESPGGPMPRRIALLGNSLPRRCGLATYTSHVHDALRARYPALAVDYYAMNDPGRSYDYPDCVTGVIRQDEAEDYREAADRIQRSGAELLWVQHEFGIFGGPAGAHLLALLERLTIPVAVTLHSVVDLPTPEQRRVMDRLARCASRLIVMAGKGRSILRIIYGIPDRKIAVIPHGVPDRSFILPGAAKPEFGLAGSKVLLTFGLLSPNKGIETMIEALPAILARHPDALYVVAGATHPHLVRHEGERYRDQLRALAERLGVDGRVRWVNSFLDQEELLDLIAAADVYITPYLDLKQITSGALSYAVALGKPVVSTPYDHAAEIIGPANGVLVGPGETAGFAEAVGSLLDDGLLRLRMAGNAYAMGRAMIWPRNVEAAMAEFATCCAAAPGPVPSRRTMRRSDRGGPALFQLGTA